jgi:hypothetical protein
VSENPSDISDLLHRWSGGDSEAFQELMPIVYNELRRLANHYLHGERGGHTLQSTAWFMRLICAWLPPKICNCKGARISFR